MAQDDYYYEIQLTNKQLIFYFLAGATGLVLAFLAGVMVGRGVDASAEAQARSPVEETRIATEETPAPASPAATADLTYAQRLEGDKPEETLAPTPRPSPSTPPVPAATPPPTPAPRSPASPAPSAAPAPSPRRAAPREAEPAPPAPGTFAIQVGAFKDRATAEAVAERLKGRGFPAYVPPPVGGAGLFNVRVGSYRARADAERVQARLRDQRYDPFIIRH